MEVIALAGLRVILAVAENIAEGITLALRRLVLAAFDGEQRRRRHT